MRRCSARGDQRYGMRPAVTARHEPERDAWCEENEDDGQLVNGRHRKEAQTQRPKTDFEPGDPQGVELSWISALMVADPAEELTGGERPLEGFRAGSVERMIDAGEGIGDGNDSIDRLDHRDEIKRLEL